MFKVGQDVVLKNSSQNKVMKIQAYNEEFIRAYWSKKEYSFAHESNFRHATEQEVAAGHRIDDKSGVTVITPSGTSRVKGGLTAFVDMGDDSHIENHVSPLCKVEAIGMSDFEKYWEENASKDSWVNKAVAWNIWKEKQSKIDELQKRLDAALKLIPSLKSENDLWGCEQVERQIELLEQALKGGGDE